MGTLCVQLRVKLWESITISVGVTFHGIHSLHGLHGIMGVCYTRLNAGCTWERTGLGLGLVLGLEAG